MEYYANRNLSRVVPFVLPPLNHQLIDIPIPNPGVFSAHPFNLLNPSFRPRNQLVVHSSPLGFSLYPSILTLMEEERSVGLLQLMVNEGLAPSTEQEYKRKCVVVKLKKIVLTWIKKVAWQRRLQREQILATSATVLTYGSYGLGVHGPESDIDALCVGPFFASMAEDFFIVLRNMLKDIPEVSDIHCVMDAKVPLMRFKFDGLLVDLPYARLQVLSVTDDVDILNPLYLQNIDETSWKSLSGVRANECILHLVPDVELFQQMLRCVKLWAKRRGVYGNLNGFLGGVHLAILAAVVCQSNPGASLTALVANFFRTFAFWPWPAPVALQDGNISITRDPAEVHSLMPIQLPCAPYEYCHSNTTRSTFYKIRAEFLRAHNFTKDLLKLQFDWSVIFEPFPYLKKYTQFVKIVLSAPDQHKLGDWVGWVKSRFRTLIIKLEEVKGLCDPNPTEYYDMNVTEPNVVFYWGLQPGKTNTLDIESVEVNFLKNINSNMNNKSYQGPCGNLKLSVVHASELLNSAKVDSDKAMLKACWSIPEYNNHQGIPVYSQHLPHYFVGYVAHDQCPANANFSFAH